MRIKRRQSLARGGATSLLAISMIRSTTILALSNYSATKVSLQLDHTAKRHSLSPLEAVKHEVHSSTSIRLY